GCSRRRVKGMDTLTANPLKPDVPLEFRPVLENFPPFPLVALRVMKVLSGTDSSLREICDLIRTDPVFTAEILRLANSPLIAFSKEITSVLQASMLLGVRRLRRLVMTVGLRSYMDRSVSKALKGCWRHSVATAII